MNIQILESVFGALEQDARLRVEANFTARQNALHYLALAAQFIEAAPPSAAGAALAARLTHCQGQLTALDAALFQRLRTQIQQGQFTPTALRLELERLTDYVRWKGETGHTADQLDVLFNGILDLDDAQFIMQATRHPEMVFYGPTPARIILLLADNAALQPDDVFYDLGSGTGRVPILLNLLTQVTTKGVEFDPALHQQACRALARLQRPNVTFIQADAREADYSDGTVFYLFTPFQGAMLQAVLARLKTEAQKRPIRLFAHGACLYDVEAQPWVRRTTARAAAEIEHYRIAGFESIY